MNFLHDADGFMPLSTDDSLSSSSVSPRRAAHRADIPPTDAGVLKAPTESTFAPNAVTTTAFSFRKVSLDRPVAPLLAQPMAPFAKKSNRKKAFMSASFYSECFLNGIGPVDADTAAMDAQSRYDKWWKSTRYAALSQQPQFDEQQQQEQQHPEKRQKRLVEHYEQQQQQNAKSPSFSVEGQSLFPSSRSCSSSSSLVVGGAMQIHRILSHQDSVVSSEGEDSKQQQQPDITKQQHMILPPQNHHHHKRPLLLLDSDIDVIRSVDHGDCRFEQNEINRAKADMIHGLKISGGDTSTDRSTTACLNFLQAVYTAQGYDARWTSHDASCSSDGAWLNLTKPTFADCLGQNEHGQCIYTLG
jgi:hypothetical protein